MKLLRRVALLGLLASAFAVSPAQATGPYDASSVMFAQMMVHHQGAIAMATPLMKSKNAEVAALCKSIVSGQSAEIKEMYRIMTTGK